jgi:hypothetical protein
MSTRGNSRRYLLIIDDCLAYFDRFFCSVSAGPDLDVKVQ